MKLISLTVENFRSIAAARKIPISQVTTLIGPNNEGKSNILRALAIGINTLVRRRARHGILRLVSGPQRRRREYHEYRWDYDYPLRLQTTKPNKSSNITLEFELSRQEIDEFEQEIGSRLNGTLPIAISYYRDRTVVSIAKQGRGHGVLNSKRGQIADFVSTRLDLQYIPAVRTAEAAQLIVDELVASELEKIEDDPLYKSALAEIAALQEPVLESLSASIAATMKSFLPQIEGVRLAITEQRRSLALRAVSEMLVNDGAETLLEYKGDGVQSLAAIAIMRHASQTRNEKKDIIIALEEPESHLHPNAIRELKSVLEDLAGKHQIVITTHNPLFANRNDIGSNIIVRNNRASSAKSIRDIRNVLGVRLDDNLTSAELVLIVEGEEDRIVLRSILSDLKPTIAEWIKNGRLVIDILGGAGNLTHRVRLHSDALCKVHVFLDNDKAGQSAARAALQQGVLKNADVNFAVCGGKPESELEDLYCEEVYNEILAEEAGSEIIRQGPDKDKKWSDQVRNLLKRHGKLHDESAILAIKLKVARSAAQKGVSAIHTSKIAPIESMANHLLAKMNHS